MRLSNLAGGGAYVGLFLAFTSFISRAEDVLVAERGTQIPLGFLPEFEPWDTAMDFTTALDTLQTTFFDTSSGNWPTSIEWTGAVLATILAASVKSLTLSDVDLSNNYFNQLVEYFGAQDVNAILGEAYDDMSWVSLNWLEGLKTIDYRVANLPSGSYTGANYTQMFADRAEQFYHAVEAGWDTTLCGGGMDWNPALEPYKNAITNELYIAASVGMYLYHPDGRSNQTLLQNAITGHNWLVGVNMTNAQGLYVDGYHISTLNNPNVTNKVCDERSEAIFTYNQGVLLSGLRGLADATNDTSYLDEGHALISAVLTSQGAPSGELIDNGTLTEVCDPDGSCSQDNQMFKGIFMHHLTAFCEPFDGVPGHTDSCTQYQDFVTFNVQQVLATRNGTGVMGSWWASPAGQTEVPSAVRRNRGLGGKGIGARAGTDLNDRGRGRTVESHGGGVAALRAALELFGSA